MYCYKLEGTKVVPATGKEAETQLKDVASCIIGKNYVGESIISTVFLAIDHNIDPKDPILFQTIIFDKGSSFLFARYRTFDEAVMGHNNAVLLVKKERAERMNLPD